MNTLNKSIIFALCVTLFLVFCYKQSHRVRDSAATSAMAPTATPATMPAVTIPHIMKGRPGVELPDETILRTIVLEDKVLKNRDAFMQEARTMNREQLLRTVEDLTRLVENYQQKLPQR